MSRGQRYSLRFPNTLLPTVEVTEQQAPWWGGPTTHETETVVIKRVRGWTRAHAYARAQAWARAHGGAR